MKRNDSEFKSEEDSRLADALYNKAEKLSRSADFCLNTIECFGLSKENFYSFLDFDASLYPHDLRMLIECSTPHLKKINPVFNIERPGEKIALKYFCCIVEEELTRVNINLVKVYMNAAKAAKQYGLYVDPDDMEDFDTNLEFYINYHVAPKGNMAEHFKEGLNRLSQLFSDAEEKYYEAMEKEIALRKKKVK